MLETDSPSTCNNKKSVTLLFLVVVALQTVVLVFAAMQKTDFHIDEIYSYVISNSSDADRFSHVFWLQDQWVAGSDFDKVTTVQDGNQFDFAAAYRNTSTDCHPPLYYWFLHAVCALVPGSFTKWTGIGLNIGLFLVCQILIYLVSCKLFDNDWLTLCPSLLYGFSALCIGNVEYIRMYVLLTVLALLYIYQNIRIVEDGARLRTLIPCCFTVFLGAMTQYYFLFFVFWTAFIYGVWLLFHKRIREALAYGAGHIAAVVGMLVVFPFAITQATGSETNNVGNEVSQSMFDVGLWKHQISYLFKETLSNVSYAPKVGKLALLVAMALVCISIFLVLKNKNTDDSQSITVQIAIFNEAHMLVWLFASFILTFLTVAKVGGNYVYVRYIYFIIPVVCICFAGVVDMGSRYAPVLVPFSLFFAIVFGAISGGYTALRGDSSYTFTDSGEIIKEAGQYTDVPLVVLLANSPTTVLTSNYTLIRTFNDVYSGSAQSILDGDSIQSALSSRGRCIVFIPTASDWTDGLNVEVTLSRIIASTGCSEPQYLFDFYYGGYYLLTK